MGCVSILQMAQALNSSTGNSLVLIDEFGKGTNTVRGTHFVNYVQMHLHNKVT